MMVWACARMYTVLSKFAVFSVSRAWNRLCQERGPVRDHLFELQVALAPFLLPIAREQVGPPGPHVAMKVLYDDGDGIGFGVGAPEQLRVVHLGEGSFAKCLVIGELMACAEEVGGGVVHGECQS